METLVLPLQKRYLQKEQTPNQSPLNCRRAESKKANLCSPFVFKSGSTRNGERQCTRTTNHGDFKNRGQIRRVPLIQSKFRPKGDDLSPTDRETGLSSALPRSELWAGPTYSSSPPPSLLPIPWFSQRQKGGNTPKSRIPDSEFSNIHLVKSTPASPSGEPSPSGTDLFLDIASATKELRRILHLDLHDD